MDEAKLMYTCFEATNDLGEYVYMIYSAKLSDLHDKKVGQTPVFNLEVVIKGLESMGCGVFGSKIVFAGGLVSQETDKKYRGGIITYDTQRKLVSYVDIPPMQGLKIRPVVFELYERLYVLSTSTYVSTQSFEIYYPKRGIWDKLSDPYLIQLSEVLGNEQISGRTPYSWFGFGNCLCISTPGDRLKYVHHAKQMLKYFMIDFDEVVPFRGMATTYWHPGFSDVVVIYLSQEGVVEGRRLMLHPSYFGEPEKIFETVPYKPDGELSSYFADFGKGAFCLTVYDNASIHVYMFTIDRLPDKENGALNFELKRLVDHKYSYSDFSSGGNKSVSFLGCFALPTDDRNKRVEEADLYRRHFIYAESCEKEAAIPLAVIMKNQLIREDADSGRPTEYWKKRVEEADHYRRHFREEHGEEDGGEVSCDDDDSESEVVIYAD